MIMLGLRCFHQVIKHVSLFTRGTSALTRNDIPFYQATKYFSGCTRTIAALPFSNSKCAELPLFKYGQNCDFKLKTSSINLMFSRNCSYYKSITPYHKLDEVGEEYELVAKSHAYKELKITFYVTLFNICVLATAPFVADLSQLMSSIIYFVSNNVLLVIPISALLVFYIVPVIVLGISYPQRIYYSDEKNNFIIVFIHPFHPFKNRKVSIMPGDVTIRKPGYILQLMGDTHTSFHRIPTQLIYIEREFFDLACHYTKFMGPRDDA